DASAPPARLAPVGPARALIGQSVQRISITATAKRMPSPEPFARFVSGPSQLGLNADARRPAGEAVRAAQP
ncbi:MAG: hypothetical protein J2P48_25035, partial [Alphaproteobacteria bacterium]|nr:hypothetical protein [Alphaproteobacteria bacterium]